MKIETAEESSLFSSARWESLKEILANALECPSPAARTAYLTQRCADDPALLREAAALLECDTTAFERVADFVGAHLRCPEKDRAGDRIGPYAIVRELGHGGMGSVYLAQRVDGHFEQQVAVKILKAGIDSNELQRRFRSEGQILAQLDHPNMTRLLDAGTTSDGLPYLIMEYVDGRPINDYATEHHLGLTERLRLFVKVCRAIEFAHQNNVVHRDIKPRNILVKADGDPKLLDFGIAKLIHTDATDAEITQLAEVRLTPAYAAPEQVAGKKATARSDIYSLGAVLNELVSPCSSANALPSVSDTTNGNGNAHSDWAPAANKDPVRGIVAKAMRLDPEKRYTSVTEFVADLAKYLQGDLPPGRMSVKARRAIIVAVAAIFAAISVTFFLRAQGWIPRRLAVPANSTGAVSATTAIRALAVLPFQSPGRDDDDKLLGFGMADAIIGRMSGLKNVIVLPTAAVSRLKDAPTDAIAAGRSLQVDAILSGTVQRSGNRVRVTVQLANVATRQTLWSDTFDQTFTDIFGIQDSISLKVAQSIAVKLSPEDQRQLAKHATGNPAAYDSYLVGLSFYNQRTQEGLAKAIDNFRQAVEKDPNYALAYALMSDCYFLTGYYKYGPMAENMAKAKEAAEQALRVDSSLAEGYLALSMAQSNYSKNGLSDQLLRRAIDLNPNLAVARQRYAWRLCSAGDLTASLSEMKRAQELDPLSSTNNTALGVVYSFARQFEPALRYCERAAVLNPNEPFIQSNVGTMYLMNNRFSEAIDHFEKAAELSPNTRGDQLASIALVLLGQKKTDEADRMMEGVLKLAAEGKVDPYNVVLFYATRGNKDEAFVWLARTMEKGQVAPGLIRYDALLDPLRSDPRFAEVLRRYHRADLLSGPN